MSDPHRHPYLTLTFRTRAFAFPKKKRPDKLKDIFEVEGKVGGDEIMMAMKITFQERKS